MTIAAPENNFARKRTKPEIVRKVDKLLDTCTYEEIAETLNNEGHTINERKPFTTTHINRMRTNYNLKKRIQRLKERGLLTSMEMTKKYRISTKTLIELRGQGLFRTEKYGGGREFLHVPPTDPKVLEIIKNNIVPSAKKSYRSNSPLDLGIQDKLRQPTPV